MRNDVEIRQWSASHLMDHLAGLGVVPCGIDGGLRRGQPGQPASHQVGREQRGLPPGSENVACMKDCATDVKLASSMPDYAKDSHGNLADQNRLVGAGAKGQAKVAKAPEASRNVELARETRELIGEAKNDLKEVKQEIREVKEELREVKDVIGKDRPDDAAG